MQAAADAALTMMSVTSPKVTSSILHCTASITEASMLDAMHMTIQHDSLRFPCASLSTKTVAHTPEDEADGA